MYIFTLLADSSEVTALADNFCDTSNLVNILELLKELGFLQIIFYLIKEPKQVKLCILLPAAPSELAWTKSLDIVNCNFAWALYYKDLNAIE